MVLTQSQVVIKPRAPANGKEVPRTDTQAFYQWMLHQSDINFTDKTGHDNDYGTDAGVKFDSRLWPAISAVAERLEHCMLHHC